MDRVLSRRQLSAAAAGLLLFTTLGTAQAADELGAAVFATHCAKCHSVKDGKNKKGPSLFGTAGGPAAAKAGFNYSEAMRRSGLTWTPQALESSLASPAAKVPGGSMKFDGLPAAADRAAGIAYLANLGTR